jgi:hypothetical protein
MLNMRINKIKLQKASQNKQYTGDYVAAISVHSC